jgi:hypothetical protein
MLAALQRSRSREGNLDHPRTLRARAVARIVTIEESMGATADKSGAGHFHAVRFYRDQDGLARIVAGFLAEGFAAGQPAVVIATPEHRLAILQELGRQSPDVEGFERGGRLFMLDAGETLDEFMIDGMPEAARFRRALTPILGQASGGRKTQPVRAYGEMVDVLWKAGHTVAATRLETLWNALANTHDFSLLCGYSMGSFYKNAAVEEICSHHSHVISADGRATLVT